MLISVVIDCAAALSCDLTPLQCTSLDLKLLFLDCLALPDYLIVKVQRGWPARLDSPDFVLQVWAEY